MKLYYDPAGNKRKMSNKFSIMNMVEAEESRIIVTGSPADIRKMMRVAEQYGFISYHCGRPIMREGRIYELHVVEGEPFYHIYRAV